MKAARFMIKAIFALKIFRSHKLHRYSRYSGCHGVAFVEPICMSLWMVQFLFRLVAIRIQSRANLLR